MPDHTEQNAPPPYRRGRTSAGELPDLAPCNFVWIESIPTGDTKVTGRYLIDPSLVVAQDQLVARNTELSNLGVDVSCDVDIDLWVNHGKETSEARTQRRSYLGGGAPQVRADSVRTTLDVASSGRSIDVRLHALGSQPVKLSLVCKSPGTHLKLAFPREYKGKLSITGQPRNLLISPMVEAQYTVVSSRTEKTESYIGHRPQANEIESVTTIQVLTHTAVFLSYADEIWTPPKVGGCQIM